jgi:hypothetical protein
MSLDSRIVEAIYSSASDAGQPESLARRLVAWMEAITSANEDLNDPSSANLHLELLYDETRVPDEEEE